MGSLAGRAKILSEDRADQDVESEASASTTVIAVSCAVEQPQQGRSISYRVGLPSTRLGLLERCRYELAAMPPMITRSFLESDQAQHIAVPDTIRVMQWNILAQCRCSMGLNRLNVIVNATFLSKQISHYKYLIIIDNNKLIDNSMNRPRWCIFG